MSRPPTDCAPPPAGPVVTRGTPSCSPSSVAGAVPSTSTTRVTSGAELVGSNSSLTRSLSRSSNVTSRRAAKLVQDHGEVLAPALHLQHQIARAHRSRNGERWPHQNRVLRLAPQEIEC